MASDYFGIPKPSEGKDPWTSDYYSLVDTVDDNMDNAHRADPGEVQSKIDTAANETGDSVVKLRSGEDYDPSQTILVKGGVILDFNGARFVPTTDRNVIEMQDKGRLLDPIVDVTNINSFSSVVYLIDTGNTSGGLGGGSDNWIAGGRTEATFPDGTIFRFKTNANSGGAISFYRVVWHRTFGGGTVYDLNSVKTDKWVNGCKFYGIHDGFDVGIHTRGDGRVAGNEWFGTFQANQQNSRIIWDMEQGDTNKVYSKLADAGQTTSGLAWHIHSSATADTAGGTPVQGGNLMETRADLVQDDLGDSTNVWGSHYDRLPTVNDYIRDSWEDGEYSGRDDQVAPAKYYNDRTESYEGRAAFRPDWLEDRGSITVNNNALVLENVGNPSRATTHSQFTTGRWKYEFSFPGGAPPDGWVYADLLYEDTDNRWYIALEGGTANFDLKKVDGGTASTLISGSWSNDTTKNTVEVVRGTNDNWRFFVNDSLQGTTTDTFVPNPGVFRFVQTGSVSSGELNVHNLELSTPDERRGTESQTGDGSATTFSWPHRFASEPTYVDVTPTSRAASVDSWVTKDAQDITVNFDTAPANGDSLDWAWEARL